MVDFQSHYNIRHMQGKIMKQDLQPHANSNIMFFGSNKHGVGIIRYAY